VLLNLIITPIFSFIGASVVAVVSNLIAAPLDVYFLWKRDIRADIFGVFKPVVIAGAYGLLFVLLGTSLLPVKLLFLFMFILTCLLMSVITRDDREVILAEAITTGKSLLRRDAECVES
jgi:O-antigen/teichoic acid export membrane protein